MKGKMLLGAFGFGNIQAKMTFYKISSVSHGVTQGSPIEIHAGGIWALPF